MDASSASQAETAVHANERFFLENIESYRRNVETIESYRHIHEEIGRHVAGVEHLLDIGNGGVFDYDASLIGKITALDLFFDRLPEHVRRDYFPANSVPVTGSALDIPFPEASFDGVLMVMLIHHLVGKTWRESWNNTERAIAEAHRVLRPGGKFVLVESCVPRWFYEFEKVVFAPTAGLVETVTSHPATIQYPIQDLDAAVGAKFKLSARTKISKGPYILQFGYKVPSALTPAQPYILVGEK
ncbi:MAG: class I SAM-dependent methyltransferase [Caulobacteraceae bacterium]